MERWPKGSRNAARALVLRSEEARRILGEAKVLDDCLSLAVDTPVVPHRAQDAASRVMDRIAAAHDSRTASLWQALPGWLLPAGGFAMAAALGITLAMITAPPITGRETILISAILDSGALAEDWVVQ